MKKKCNLDVKNAKLVFSIKFIQGFFLFFKRNWNIYGHECLVIDFTVIFLLGYMCAHTSVFTVEGRVAPEIAWESEFFWIYVWFKLMS